MQITTTGDAIVTSCSSGISNDFPAIVRKTSLVGCPTMTHMHYLLEWRQVTLAVWKVHYTIGLMKRMKQISCLDQTGSHCTPRHLTALEKYRITGAMDAHGQIAAFDRLGIQTTARMSRGAQVIECVVHTNDVRACLNEDQWLEVRDENIGTGGKLLNRTQKQNKNNQHKQNSTVVHTRFDR